MLRTAFIYLLIIKCCVGVTLFVTVYLKVNFTFEAFEGTSYIYLCAQFSSTANQFAYRVCILHGGQKHYYNFLGYYIVHYVRSLGTRLHGVKTRRTEIATSQSVLCLLCVLARDNIVSTAT